MSEAFLIGGARTPVGRYGGALSSVRPDDLASVRPDDLAAVAIRAAVERSGLDPASVDEVIYANANANANANGAGEVVDTSIGWRFTNPAFLSGEYSRGGRATYSMPETAEEVARVYNTPREDCDAFVGVGQGAALLVEAV